MSAELRRAASQMRTAAREAEKQYASPWHDEADEVLDRRGTTVADVAEMSEINYLTEHIASWHPAVALAVADLLDEEAYGEENGHWDASHLAIAVARAYLGETS